MTNEEIQQHIERNCRYPDGSSMMPERTYYEGAKWARDQMFTKEDMAEFAEWFSANWDLDFKADSALEIWRKERKKK